MVARELTGQAVQKKELIQLGCRPAGIVPGRVFYRENVTIFQGDGYAVAILFEEAEAAKRATLKKEPL